MKTLALFSSLAFVCMAAGCGSTGKLTQRQAFTTQLGQYKSATVQVKSELSESPDGLDEFLVQLESRIIAKLRAADTFEKVYPGAASDLASDLAVTVAITKVRDVNNFDRVMWGALAGQANTRATVEVRERSSDRVLGVGDIEGKSSGGSVFAGTTAQAVERVADEVVRWITQNR